jgi:hypothetical protein
MGFWGLHSRGAMNFQFDEGLWGQNERKKKKKKDHLVVGLFCIFG